MSRGSVGFVSLFAFFLESFAHLLVARKLELRSLLASHLTGGGASLGSIIAIGTAITVAVSAAVISAAIAVAAVSAAVISTAIATPLNSAVDASNAAGC
jgi:hypothetical protein